MIPYAVPLSDRWNPLPGISEHEMRPIGRGAHIRSWHTHDVLPLWTQWPQESARLGPTFSWWRSLGDPSPDSLHRWCALQSAATAAGRGWWLAIEGPEQRLLGGVSLALLRWPPWRARRVRLGGWLFKDAEGKGWMTAAFTALMEDAWERLGCSEVEWRTPSTHPRTSALNRRLGGYPTTQRIRSSSHTEPLVVWRAPLPFVSRIASHQIST